MRTCPGPGSGICSSTIFRPAPAAVTWAAFMVAIATAVAIDPPNASLRLLSLGPKRRVEAIGRKYRSILSYQTPETTPRDWSDGFRPGPVLSRCAVTPHRRCDPHRATGWQL